MSDTLLLVDIAAAQLVGPSALALTKIARAWHGRAHAGMAQVWVANGHLGSLSADLGLPSGPGRAFYGDFPLGLEACPWAPETNEAGHAAYWGGLVERFAPTAVHHWLDLSGRLPIPPLLKVPQILSLPDARPEQLLADPLRRLLQAAAKVLTPSDAMRQTLLDVLPVAPQRIRALAPWSMVSDGREQSASESVPSNAQYILCILDGEQPDALELVLHAFAAWRSSAKHPLPLVCVAPLSEPESFRYEAMAERLGVSTWIQWLDTCRLPEVAPLMRDAALCLGPLDGNIWGLRMQKAIDSGVPLVALDTPTHRELAETAHGMAVRLVALEADALPQALQDLLGRRGAARAAPASKAAEGTQRLAIDPRQIYGAGKTARQQRARTGGDVRRVALVSPMPPQRTGISDFSAALMTSLSRHVEVTAYVAPGALHATSAQTELPIRAITTLADDVVVGRVDGVLYQVGNSDYHLYQLPYLLSVPGVVELHDGVLYDLMWAQTLATGREDQYLLEMSYAHGSEGRRRAEEALAGQRPANDGRITAIRRALNLASGVIVHNDWAEQRVRAEHLGVPMLNSAHPVDLGERADRPRTRDGSRDRLGMPREALVFGTFGRLTMTKRLVPILRAFKELVGDGGLDARLYMVGALDLAGGAGRVREMIDALGLQDRVTITGYVERETFLDYFVATDVGLNLRYPHAGETSGTLMLMLDAGVPVITSNTGAFARFPDDCCWKVDVGPAEEALLLAYMRRLANDAALRARMSANAIAYVRSAIPTYDQAAERVLAFMQACRQEQDPLLPRAQRPEEVLAWTAVPGMARWADAARRRSPRLWPTFQRR